MLVAELSGVALDDPVGEALGSEVGLGAAVQAASDAISTRVNPLGASLMPSGYARHPSGEGREMA